MVFRVAMTVLSHAVFSNGTYCLKQSAKSHHFIPVKRGWDTLGWQNGWMNRPKGHPMSIWEPIKLLRIRNNNLRIPPLFRFQAEMTQNSSNTLIRYIGNIFDRIWYLWRHLQKFSKFLFCPLVTSEMIFFSRDWHQNDQQVISFKMMYYMTTFYI